MNNSVGSKVANVTLAFWIMKICATTLGETGGDLLSMTMDIGYVFSSAILLMFFIATLALQLRAKRFHPFLYWAVIIATSTAGTTMSDCMDRTLGLGYAVGSGILIALLISILFAWKKTIGHLSVDHVEDRRVECFYWLAILVSNTLGTAFGDFLADTSGLGYAMSNILISAVLIVITLAYFFTKVSRTALFWMAFVLTRPFGATMGDLLTKGAEKGGLGFGTLVSSSVLGIVLIAMIAWSYQAHRKRQVPVT